MDDFGNDWKETSSMHSTSYTPADKGERLIAAVIDLIIAGLLSAVLFHPIAWAVSTGYILTRDALPFLNGQSIGKRVYNLRVIKEGAGPITDDYGSSVIRNLTLVLPLVPLLNCWFCLLAKIASAWEIDLLKPW